MSHTKPLQGLAASEGVVTNDWRGSPGTGECEPPVAALQLEETNQTRTILISYHYVPRMLAVQGGEPLICQLITGVLLPIGLSDHAILSDFCRNLEKN